MKKILKTLVIILISTSIYSCGENFLDVTPKDRLTDATFWTNEHDVTMALNGCYRGWESIYNIVSLDASSDNGYDQFNANYQDIANGQLRASSSVGLSSGFTDSFSTRWFRYERIRKYNNFLKKVEEVEMNADLKRQYIAEVRFLRAYDYFYKIMFYGDMPLVKELIEDPMESNLSRTPKAEIETFILAELAEVAQMLPERNVIDSKGHVTKGSALALKARLELYLGRYDDAQSSAAAVIDMPCYELYPDYEEMFYPSAESTNKEVILTVEYLPNDYVSMLPQSTLPATEGGWSALNALWPLVEAYETITGKFIDDPDTDYNPDEPFKNRDPRLTQTILCPGEWYNGRYYNPLDQFIDGQTDRRNLDYYAEAAASRGGLLMKKYVYPMTIDEANNYDGNAIVIRLAEMYITFAECALHTGRDQDKALNYINMVRNRVGMPNASTLTEKLVRNERRVELAFEGLRYFDLKRWDLGPTLLNGWAIGSRTGTIDSSTGKVTWGNDFLRLEERIFYPERNYLINIPQSELDRNPNMTQNPGY